MYFETYEKIKLYASLYPEEFDSLTQQELDTFRSSLNKQKNQTDSCDISVSAPPVPDGPTDILNN